MKRMAIWIILPLLLGLAGCSGGGWHSAPMHGPGMGYGSGPALTLEQAVVQAQRHVAGLGLSELELVEVMQFDNHFYLAIREHESDYFAFELLMSLDGRSFWPEPGPNMMWNTKYGGWFHGHRLGSSPTGTIIGQDRCRALAQGFLNEAMPGWTIDDEADAFYGYYTMHTLWDGQIAGMLSVNAVTGEVWPHTWHGDLIALWHHDHS